MYLTHYYCDKILVPRAGFEPTLAVPKTAVLPLHNLGIINWMRAVDLNDYLSGYEPGALPLS